MKELLEVGDLKGIPRWKIYNLLHAYGWELYLHTEIQGLEWHNKDRKRINKEAIEKALIELDFMI